MTLTSDWISQSAIDSFMTLIIDKNKLKRGKYPLLLSFRMYLLLQLFPRVLEGFNFLIDSAMSRRDLLPWCPRVPVVDGAV